MKRNNLELRKCQGENTRFEIVKWVDNDLFGKECEYPILQNGMRYKTNRPQRGFSEGLFTIKQLCYTIVLIEKGIPDFIGDRLYELENKEEFIDFIWLLRSAVKKSIRWKIKTK